MDRNRVSRYLQGLAFLCRLGLAVVFFLAAWPKIQDPAAFAKAISNYHIAMPVIGMNYINAMAFFLPALEMVLALILVASVWKRGAGLLAAILMVMFIAAISSAMARNLNIDCGCFGSTKLGAAIAHKVGLRRLLEDVAYLMMASIVFWEAVASRKQVREGET